MRCAFLAFSIGALAAAANGNALYGARETPRRVVPNARNVCGAPRAASEVRQYNPLVPRAEVCLSIDCRQTGLRCNNCGPLPLPQYRFPVEKTTWRCRIEAVVP